jgi:hypothetical protein
MKCEPVSKRSISANLCVSSEAGGEISFRLYSNIDYFRLNESAPVGQTPVQAGAMSRRTRSKHPLHFCIFPSGPKTGASKGHASAQFRHPTQSVSS